MPGTMRTGCSLDASNGRAMRAAGRKAWRHSGSRRQSASGTRAGHHRRSSNFRRRSCLAWSSACWASSMPCSGGMTAPARQTSLTSKFSPPTRSAQRLWSWTSAAPRWLRLAALLRRGLCACGTGRLCTWRRSFAPIRKTARSCSKAAGQEPVAPYAYVTTQKFLEVFGLASLRDLPEIEGLEDVGLLQRPANETDLDGVL